MIVIFSYDRPQMLWNSLQELKEFDHEILVVDDASEYDSKLYERYCDYRRSEHNGGKEGFWRQWQWAFDIINNDYPDEQHVIFMPDDWNSWDIQTLDWINEQFSGPYAFNIVNRGHSQSWTPLVEYESEINGWKCLRNGFVDCAFSTNRKTLSEFLKWKMAPIGERRFIGRPRISSGVGRQLSFRFFVQDIPIYKPIKSLAWHDGTHESKMHPFERKQNPNVPI